LILRLVPLVFLLAFAGALVAPPQASAAGRVALVIGNSAYKFAPRLNNSVNDASDIAAALERLGFDVVRGIDLDYAGMREHVLRFSEQLAGADVGLFYYAGHGLQVSGRNYLAPIDLRLESEADLDFRTIDLDLVLRNMTRETRTNIVFLDACRDNPLAAQLARRMGARSAAISRGLAQVVAGVGTLIAFATEPGNVALDGENTRNSPFTAALLDTIERPGLHVGDVMIAVRNQVLKQTRGKQVPWEHSSLTGKFYFVPQSAPSPGRTDEAFTPKEINPLDLELAFWNSIKNSKNARLFEAYLARYPNGAFAELAKIALEELRIAALKPPVEQPEDKVAISDPGLLREIRDRLYELNFDPGPLDEPMGEAAFLAIREYETMSKLPITGQATNGLLRRLRESGGLRPWGAIVYAKGSDKWGMAWAHATRKEAVASARASCGAGVQCSIELSFFGAECAAFAYAGGAFALAARDTPEQARSAALAECSARGRSCRIVAAVCANGAGRAGVPN
jgi:hypothetical protein